MLLFLIGAIAMSLMHCLSVLIGAAFPYLLSHTMTEALCVVMFLGYGLYMIYDTVVQGD